MLRKITYFLTIILFSCMANAVDQLNIDSDDWEADFSHEIILVDVGGVLAPIEIEKPTLTLNYKDVGEFVISEGKMNSLTTTGIATARATTPSASSAVTFSQRPTLFVSIGGWKGISSGIDSVRKGEGIASWQATDDASTTDLTDVIIRNVGSDYQFYIMSVDWYSSRQIKGQVKQMANKIKRFLKGRNQAWDVALVGHSRGGIFAHELSKELVGNNKINTLNTMLLDPTALPLVGDTYPAYKRTSSSTSHYAEMLYDGSSFVNSIDFNATTVSDDPISGYSSSKLDTTHVDIPYDWLTNDQVGAQNWLANIITRKQPNALGYFEEEADVANDNIVVITIKVDHDIHIDGGITITGDYLEVWGEMSVGPVGAAGSLYLSGKSVEVSANAVFQAASVSLDEDHVQVNQSIGLAGYSAGLADRNLSADVTIGGGGGLNAAACLGDCGIGVSANVLGLSADASISGTGSEVNIGGVRIFKVGW